MTDAEKRTLVAERRSLLRNACLIQTRSDGYRWWRDRYPGDIGRRLELWFDQFMRCALTEDTDEITDPLWLADDGRWERLFAPLRNFPFSVLVPGPDGSGGFDTSIVQSAFETGSSTNIHNQFHELEYSETTGLYTPLSVSPFVLPKFSGTGLETVANYLGFKSWIPGYHAFENLPVLTLPDVATVIGLTGTVTHTFTPTGGRPPYRWRLLSTTPAGSLFNAEIGQYIYRHGGAASDHAVLVEVEDAYRQKAQGRLVVDVSSA